MVGVCLAGGLVLLRCSLMTSTEGLIGGGQSSHDGAIDAPEAGIDASDSGMDASEDPSDGSVVDALDDAALMEATVDADAFEACSPDCGACCAFDAGVCSPLPSTKTCRHAESSCDLEEKCDGITLECPPDEVKPTCTINYTSCGGQDGSVNVNANSTTTLPAPGCNGGDQQKCERKDGAMRARYLPGPEDGGFSWCMGDLVSSGCSQSDWSPNPDCKSKYVTCCIPP
jgi:hypothetical protein